MIAIHLEVLAAMNSLCYYQTSIGKVAIAENGLALTHFFFPGELPPAEIPVRETALLKTAADQLRSYLAKQRQDFDLPLAPAGTPFMQQVWTALQEIPYGETCSYRDIAQRIGRPKACRAVGQANNRNPLPIFIPCHRVIGASGNLVGYGGGLAIKIQLLALEKEDHDQC